MNYSLDDEYCGKECVTPIRVSSRYARLRDSIKLGRVLLTYIYDGLTLWELAHLLPSSTFLYVIAESFYIKKLFINQTPQLRHYPLQV